MRTLLNVVSNHTHVPEVLASDMKQMIRLLLDHGATVGRTAVRLFSWHDAPKTPTICL